MKKTKSPSTQSAQRIKFRKPVGDIEEIATITGKEVLKLEEDMRKRLEPKIRRLEEWRRRSLEDAKVRVLR